MQEELTKALTGIAITVLGPCLLKNELFRLFLEVRGGAAAHTPTRPGGLNQLRGMAPHTQHLVLCDVQGLTPEDILARLSEVSNLPQLNTALVDLASDRQLERAAFQMGVKGFFYLGDGPELLFKGLRTMRGGHTWVPRKVLESCLMDTSGRYWRTGGGNGLTRRQEEVLQLLSRGYRNAEIARQLELSTNTVKAHIYQAFKKIKVNSRMQAARWASYNLASRALP